MPANHGGPYRYGKASRPSRRFEVSYSEARARFAELLESVTDDHDVVRIRRQGNKRAAVLIDADDYASLEETAYLLSSPANARHILRSLAELKVGHGRVYEAADELWRDLEAEVEPVTKSGPDLEPTFTNQEAIDPAVIDRIPEQSRVEIFSSNGMTCKLVVAPAVREDLGWWRHTNPTRLEHIRRMLGAVLTDPFGGIGKPEPLRGLSNTWSRRIDKRHRLVYRVYDDRIEIVAGRYHYGQ